MDVYNSDIDLDGNIDGNHHLGHIMLECFRKRRPDDIFQIDAGTGEEETYGSVLSRTISMARSLRKAGLRPGDVMSLGGRNHLNLRIPFYAALMNGLPVVGIDPIFKYDEIKRTLKLLQPKISFCEHGNYEQYVRAAEELALDTLVVTFYHGENSMASFMAKYDNDGNEKTEEFKPAYFDTEKVWAWLVSTSGSTGANKFVAIRHGTAGLQYLIRRGAGGSFVENGQKTCLNVSSVQWISSYLNVMNMPLMNSKILQSSKITGVETYIDVINKYKPSTVFIGPSLISLILRNKKKCDLTCLDVICVAGAKVYKETLLQLRTRVRKDTVIHEVYGHSETMGGILCSDGPSPTGSCFADTDLYEIKLIEATTGAEVVEPHKQGELFVKGPGVFSEYYNDPEETAKGFSKDGFYKTGDVFYRDEYGNYYFVERLKMLIKCRGTQIIPPELEEVIAAHPDVLEVCVTGIPHPEDEERPVACVVRTPGSHISVQDIKDLVAEKLSEGKQLRGGVVFLEELPKTTSGKVARMEIKKLVASLNRE